MSERRLNGKNRGFVKRFDTDKAQSILPNINVKYIPEPHKYIRKKEKEHKPGNRKLTWEQVCEMRKWHEVDRMPMMEVFILAQTVGWPISSYAHARRLLTYITRTRGR